MFLPTYKLLSKFVSVLTDHIIFNTHIATMAQVEEAKKVKNAWRLEIPRSWNSLHVMCVQLNLSACHLSSRELVEGPYRRIFYSSVNYE